MDFTWGSQSILHHLLWAWQTPLNASPMPEVGDARESQSGCFRAACWVPGSNFHTQLEPWQEHSGMSAPIWGQTQPLSWGNSYHPAQCMLSKLISKGKRETSPILSPAASLVNSTFFTMERGTIQRGNIAWSLPHKPAPCESWGLSVPAASTSSSTQWAPHLTPCPSPLGDLVWCVPNFPWPL